MCDRNLKFYRHGGLLQEISRRIFQFAIPITKLRWKSDKFEWTKEYETSFEELKTRLVLALILDILEGNEGFII